MTFQKLNNLIIQHNIPNDVKLLSDSGWECDETEMDGVYFNKKLNAITFTQKISEYDSYYKDKEWTPLYCKEE